MTYGRQTYTSSDFRERLLENYGYSEWIGQRGAFMGDAIACGVLSLGRATPGVIAGRSTLRSRDRDGALW